jgi:phosphonate transport system ATP-binding protein
MNGDVRFRSVSVRFGELAAVDGLDGEIAAGEHVALIGPSGAGKTTLLRLINASVLPSAGHVGVGGRDLAALDAPALRRLRRQVAVIHQDLRLVPNLRVSQNVLSGGFGRQGFWSAARTMLRPSRDQLEQVHGLLERVGIGDKLFHRTDRLSGGQQQRVAIARALYQRPRILLADEPVASVDPARSRDVVRLLTTLAREDGITLIASLHDLDLAREFFPRAIGLRDGRMIRDGDTRLLTASDLDRLYDLPTSRGALDDP